MSEPTPYIFDVTTANFDQAVIQNSFEKPVLVDFWAEWCAPCKALMPLLAQSAESYQGELLLAKVDCEAEQDIVARFGIRSLPTVVLFKDGQLILGGTGLNQSCLGGGYLGVCPVLVLLGDLKSTAGLLPALLRENAALA